MHITEILTPERTFSRMQGGSKKRVLETVAKKIAQQIPHLEPNTLFDNLVNRERLGSTAIGHGVAIPHCRLTQCSNTIGSLIHLDQAVDFDSSDNVPVDLLFILLVPADATDEHLKTLSSLAELFSQSDYRKKLRATTNQQTLFEVATQA